MFDRLICRNSDPNHAVQRQDLFMLYYEISLDVVKILIGGISLAYVLFGNNFKRRQAHVIVVLSCIITYNILNIIWRGGQLALVNFKATPAK